jgi:hypothetical protein
MFKLKIIHIQKVQIYKVHIKPIDKTKTGEETNRTLRSLPEAKKPARNRSEARKRKENLTTPRPGLTKRNCLFSSLSQSRVAPSEDLHPVQLCANKRYCFFLLFPFVLSV